MPIRSKRQWKFLKINEPELFSKFQKEHPVDYASLPDKKEEKMVEVIEMLKFSNFLLLKEDKNVKLLDAAKHIALNHVNNPNDTYRKVQAVVWGNKLNASEVGERFNKISNHEDFKNPKVIYQILTGEQL